MLEINFQTCGGKHKRIYNKLNVTVTVLFGYVQSFWQVSVESNKFDFICHWFNNLNHSNPELTLILDLIFFLGLRLGLYLL